MQYQTCPHCGAHLDFGERCDCRDKKKPPPDGNRESGKEIIHHYFIRVGAFCQAPGGRR